MQAPKPPPVVDPEKQSKPPGWRFQFNTASLLGLMALVAVGCVLVLALPQLLVIAAALVSVASLVAYSGFLVGGAVAGEGERRMFAISALFCLSISAFTGLSGVVLNQLGIWWSYPGVLFVVIQPAVHIVFSLFGGWVAIQTRSFWKP